ncbi:MAG: serine protease [Rhodobacteraceae bacterium]|nr:serine protease [Paracoccaceae bacterium]
MKQVIRTMVLAAVAACALAAGARAQEAWVQIEALPTLAQGEERARAWASAFPEVNGFRLRSGWYGIALGPFTAEEAANRLFALRAERLIPADSFVADGREFAGRFWPVGAGALPPADAATGDGAAAAPQETAALPVAPSAEPPAEPPDGPPAEPPAEAPDETPAEARRSEAALGEEERRALQTALQWFGFYDGAIDGAFGRGTRSSMAAWQDANGHEATGILTTRQREALLGAYREDREALGLGRVVETRAGIEIEMPIGLVEFDDYAPPFVRYREKDGSGVQVLLISQDGTQATLDGLYDVMQTLEIVPPEGFRERRGDSFTLTGQGPEFHSHTYARLRDGMIKGFTLIYPAGQAQRMARAIGIMQQSLTSIGPALDPTLGPQGGGQARDLLSGLEVRQPERIRSGVFVDPSGAVLTVAEAVAGCGRVTLDDRHEATVAAVDAASGLALLRPKTPLAPRQVAALAPEAPRIGAAAAVAGFPFGTALPAATLTFGRVEDVRGLDGEAHLLRLTAETEAGEVGGPVLDPAGRLAGLLLPPEEGGRVLPPGVRFAARAESAAAFLAAQGVTPRLGNGGEAEQPPDDLAQAAREMTVLVSCWK